MRSRKQVGQGAVPSLDRSKEGTGVSEVVVGTVNEVEDKESRVLVDIDEAHTFWEIGGFEHGTIEGAIVRLCPPASVTDAELADIERQVREAGAVAVKIQRREVAAPGLLPRMTKHVRNGEHRDLTHREVVHELLARVKANDPEAICALVLSALDHGERQSKPVLRPRAGEPLYVKSVRLMNWQCFRGRHEVMLEPTVYAITAEHEEQSGRSNWLGKSTFLGAFPFVFYGWHTRPKEDAWITDDEEEGGVAVTLSDETMIMRVRTRGKATRVTLRRQDGSQAHGEEAEREIAERVGLTQADFFSTSFFVQKAIGQFVTMQPARRQELIAGWLDLGPLRAAEDWAREQLDEAVQEEMRLREARAAWEREVQTIAQMFGNPGDAQVEATIEQTIAQGERALVEAQERAAAARSAGQVIRQRESIARAQATRARVEAELRTAEADAAGIDRLALQIELEATREVEGKARSARDTAQQVEQERVRLLVGGFDGKCPIARIECPAVATINARRDEAKTLHEEAVHELDVKRGNLHDAAVVLREVEQRVRVAESKVQAVREKARALEAAKQFEESLGAMPPEILVTETPEQADARVRELAREVEGARIALQRVQKAQQGAKQAGDVAEKAAKQAALYGAAARLLGRGEGGAQREIAQGALASIEASTNASLAAAGVNLTVTLRWGGESTTELAGHCSGCGASFLASKRVKACARCGAARGPKLDEKVDFTLSNRSGAADDLAGFHLQIAAAAWLYGRRGVPWRTIAVDEPFGALDEVHRRAMGVHVAGLLRSRYAFEQAFVIAHDTMSTDTMQARIRIIAGRDGSRVVVEA